MAWIVPVASAVIGAAGSYLSARKGKKSADQLRKQQQPLVDVQTQTARALQPYATGFYDRAQRAIDPALKYYTGLMSGNRSDLVSALAPEIEGINRGYANTLQTQRELSPRGGATTAFAAELPFRRQSEIQALVAGGRRDAAAQLPNLASTAANIGSGAAGYSLNAAIGANTGIQNMYNNQQYANTQQASAYAQLAQTLLSQVHYNADTGKWGWGTGG